MPYVNKGLSTKICSFIEDITGSIITINNQFNDRLLSLKATIEATQQGSGTPSPDNVRPIVSVSEVNITQQVTDMADRIYTINLGGTYYGGVLDVTSGVLRVERAYYKTTGTEDWLPYVYRGGNGVAAENILPNLGNRQPYISNMSNYSSSTLFSSGALWCGVNNSQQLFWIGILDILEMTLEEFKTWIVSNPLEVAYDLREQDQFYVQLTPTEVELAIRQNTIFADTGNLEAIYKTYTPT